ncbi:DMATS type aromatic prenyltransferase [Catenuloplanes nepalensis]|uniref:DMATS type aromatic prenyltransferase n=1 Tax=Catenuloplanes nepalensis TaxID=587533 RepID=A0ABT9MTE8_9ACTN|nr:tryptophan dimethylallyltransferase family protein [Catenuloplanes nepalensis]MDP9794709.1 DMATS type aromatic prenyltransferase [Catenuloplanes nepalensis]
MPDKSGRTVAVRHQQLFSASSDTTHAALLTSIWDRIRTAAWAGGEREDTRAHLADMLHPWAHRPIETVPRYPSFVSGDGFPAELSVSWRKGVAEVRILFEPVGADPAARAVQDAGRAMVRALAGRDGVSIRAYEVVEDLFTVDDPPAYRSGVWLSLACGPDTPPHFKVYLNPYVNGAGREWDTVTRAMERLGLAAAWAPIAADRDALAATGTGLDYVALDLSAGAHARAKIYFRHRGAGLDGIHRLGAFARSYDPERTQHAAAVLYGTDPAVVAGADPTAAAGADPAAAAGADPAVVAGADPGGAAGAGLAGRLDNEPMTGLAFRSGRDGADEANVYFRLPGAVRSDAEAAARITTLMEREGAPADVYRRIADAIAPAPTDTTSGVHELVSYRTRDAGPADIGVYFRLPVHASAPDDVPRPGHGWPRVPAP